MSVNVSFPLDRAHAAPATAGEAVAAPAAARLAWVSRAAAFAALLIVFSHSAPPATRNQATADAFTVAWQFARTVFLTFEVHVFFVLSGVLCARSLARPSASPVDYIRRRAVRLLLPYVLLSTLVFPLKLLMTRYALHPVADGLASYLHMLVYPRANTIATYWFLPVLLATQVIGAFALRPVLRMPAVWQGGATALLVAVNLATVPSTANAPVLLCWTDALHFLLYVWCGMLIERWLAGDVTRLGSPGVTRWMPLLAAIPWLLCAWKVHDTDWGALTAAASGVAAICWLAQRSLAPGKTSWSIVERHTMRIYLFSWFWQQAMFLVFSAGWVSAPTATVLGFAGGVIAPIVLSRLLNRCPQALFQRATGA